ncbi:MAG: peptide chain release factor N(5)-glutamine methyltransferase, partial [Christensenella sp.]
GSGGSSACKGLMESWGTVFKHTVKALREAGLAEAEAESRVLMAQVYGGDFSALCLRFLDVCDKQELAEKFVRERISGKPLAYVLGEKYFYGRRFAVDERVLIPRYDTECVVQRALKLAGSAKTALDLCCGSGIMGVTLGAEMKLDSICFADNSEGALKVAEENAKALIPRQKTKFVNSDFLRDIHETFDIIVCNPPYISERDYAELEPQVREYEPKTALTAENNGYAFYERAAKEAPHFLNAGGGIVLEIGDTQKEGVCALLKQGGFDNIECGLDLSGSPRWVSGIKGNN